MLAAALSLFSLPGQSLAAPPVCSNPTAALTSDYQYVVGSAAFSDPDHDPETGSTFRWLVNGDPLVTGQVSEGLLLHFDGAPEGANGESPHTAQDVGYTAGRFGKALALGSGGNLWFSRADNLPLTEGTWELWTALRADGSDPRYADSQHWQVLLYYRAPNEDWLAIAQSNQSGILYAGGEVGGKWQSAYGNLANTRTWQAGEWHHIAFTFSAAGNYMRFYVDGVLAADTNEGSYTPPSQAGELFSLGGTLWGQAADYYLDEVRLSGQPATAGEIAARAQRASPPGPNETWLPTALLQPGDRVVYEFTPHSGGENVTLRQAPLRQAQGACASPTLTYPGIPVTNPQPPSTLLPAGSSSLQLTVNTPVDTTCAWSVGQSLPYDQMATFASLAPSQVHTTTVSGLDPNPAVVNEVYVRCASHPDYLLHLRYRSLANVNPPFPRTGNLWGAWGFLEKGLDYMARIDLWLGADALSGEQMRDLRARNPHALALTSINAVENNDLSDPRCNGCQGIGCEDWFLKDVHGQKIEVWPGSYRINLTNPAVAEYQACYAYQTVLERGLLPDGVFFDNVMTTQSWLTHDIYGNPLLIDADQDGKADDPDDLDAAWKAGVFHEIETFRRAMPYAVVGSHSTDIYEPGVAQLFNGNSLGFATANVIEGEERFANLLARYQEWMSQAQTPRITMFEASPIDQIAYGYDYDPLSKIPTTTLEFARTYYPWMRFGLALTLMDDGYFAYEFGDTHHGNDWWYDELDFNLGYPLGPASLVATGFDPGPNLVSNPSFEQPLEGSWSLWASQENGAQATASRETGAVPDGTAAARIDVQAISGVDWHIEFAQRDRNLQAGVTYNLAFWARSDVTRTITLSSQKGSPDWDNYGLWRQLQIGPTWQEYAIPFQATATVSDARLQFLLGSRTGTVWLDNVRLTRRPPQVYRRDFTHGSVLLNGERSTQAVTLGPGYRRLSGSQAPRLQLILDDAATGFTTTGSWVTQTLDSGEWQASGPFYHDWGESLHLLNGASGEARWSLPITATDTYTISAWWPAAPGAAGWNPAARFEIIADSRVLASAVFDQHTGGDQWHTVGVVPLVARSSASVRLACTGAPCAADAVYLSSRARYNDSAPATTITLAGLDGIILSREARIFLPLLAK